MRPSTECNNAVLSEVTKSLVIRAQWSIRSMASVGGVSKNHVQTLRSGDNIKNHGSREPNFWDVVGLYLHAPKNADSLL